MSLALERILPCLLDSEPLGIQRPPPIVCALYPVSAHCPSAKAGQTHRLPGRPGCYLPPKQKGIEMEASAQPQRGFLCNLLGPPIHMNGGSRRLVGLPSCCTLLLGSLRRINRVSFNQSINQPGSVCTVCLLSAQPGCVTSYSGGRRRRHPPCCDSTAWVRRCGKEEKTKCDTVWLRLLSL